MSNSFDVDTALSDCPEYDRWSNERYSESLDHYSDDPDYLIWAAHFAQTHEALSDEQDLSNALADDQSMSDEDWRALKAQWDEFVPVSNAPPVDQTEESESFFDSYCY